MRDLGETSIGTKGATHEHDYIVDTTQCAIEAVQDLVAPCPSLLQVLENRDRCPMDIARNDQINNNNNNNVVLGNLR